MRMMFVLLTFALGLRLLGDSLPAAEFTHAVAVRGCMQEDTPALEIYLTQEPYSGEALPTKPYLRIEIAWSEWANFIERDLKLVQFSRNRLKPQQPIVRAALIERQAPIWLQGIVRLKKVELNKQVEGSYEFTGPNDLRSGTFKASWGRDRPPCG
jgi:hypothetical protein